MDTAPVVPTPTPVVVEKARRVPKPRRHRLEENPPPPMRAYSIDQIEHEHPGIKGQRKGRRLSSGANKLLERGQLLGD
jgi:hypothetical protein